MHLDAIERELRTVLADIKLRTTLEWEPRIEYGDGLAATLAWLRSEGVQRPLG